MKLFKLPSFLLASIGFIGTSKMVLAEGTCNKRGGSMQSFEGSCDSRNYTWSDQCNVEEVVAGDGTITCQTTYNSCGCKVYSGGGSSAVGSGSKGCANACVDISSDVPSDRTCQASGSAVSFDGSCDSRGYTYTPQCNFAEEEDSNLVATKCTITASSCGCLWWEENSTYMSGLAAPKNCDACTVGASSVAATDTVSSGALSTLCFLALSLYLI